MTKNKDEIVQQKEWFGVLSCDFKYKIATTEVKLDYKGPKIPHDEWHKMMSFFRWTYQTGHSEAQVRGYIDPVDKKIFFWAFPQEAKTGMTTTEIEGDEWKAQRAALPHAGELEYFMTVHHHCAASAFQSGGDTANEERPGGGAHETGQEGLHITVGKMDEAMHDIDARFYFNSTKMSPALSVFWDIGDVARMVPADLHEKIARYQMCQKIEVPFPEQWKANWIEVKPKFESLPARYQGGLGYDYHTGMGSSYKSLTERIHDSAWEVLDKLLVSDNLMVEDVEKSLEFLAGSAVMDAILTECTQCRYDAIDLNHLIEELIKTLDVYKEEMMDEALEEQALAEGAVDKGGNKGKNGGRRRKRGKGKVTTIEVVETEPKHGDVNGMGGVWDSDLKTWVAPDSYGA